jgi:superfamily I DNA/RNA helicase
LNFRIADTFTDSLARLRGEEQKAVKTTAFDLQLNPAAPGLGFHKLDRARDKNFWSVRVNADLRIIVHRTEGNLLLCYVDHHDNAYAWAERRKLEIHPQTGAAQLVEIRERVQEILVPQYVAEPVARSAISTRRPFAHCTDADLLQYGVPVDWLEDVRVATEDDYLALADHLPAEAAEALLELATGGTPRLPEPLAVPAHPFDHPDAQRRFRVMRNVEELDRALSAPWEKWSVFLHPDQRQWVARTFNGPARVTGSAGTGKTVVALHRAVHLARTYPEARILLSTFSEALAHALQTRLRCLVWNEPRLGERIDVYAFQGIGRRLYRAHLGPLHLADAALIRDLLQQAWSAVTGHRFTLPFLASEWEQVVDAWQIRDWEAYRDVARLGRKTRLPGHARAVLWTIFEQVWRGLEGRQRITPAGMFTRLATTISQLPHSPFDGVVVDEAQDMSIPHLKFFAALGRQRPDALFFAGDLGQRIFQQPFSWKTLGIEVRGRSRNLRINYRTSHQIRLQADRLLGPEITDVDGNTAARNDTISVFNGPLPQIVTASDEAEECREVASWLTERIQEGILPHEIGVFVRSDAQCYRALAAVEAAGHTSRVLDEHVAFEAGAISVSTMHLAKGLEFRAVAVMACDDDVVPLQERIQAIGDDADLREVYDTERHLLYVACTRARDHLLITSAGAASEFLDDLLGA